MMLADTSDLEEDDLDKDYTAEFKPLLDWLKVQAGGAVRDGQLPQYGPRSLVLMLFTIRSNRFQSLSRQFLRRCRGGVWLYCQHRADVQ